MKGSCTSRGAPTLAAGCCRTGGHVSGGGDGGSHVEVVDAEDNPAVTLVLAEADVQVLVGQLLVRAGRGVPGVVASDGAGVLKDVLGAVPRSFPLAVAGDLLQADLSRHTRLFYLGPVHLPLFF